MAITVIIKPFLPCFRSDQGRPRGRLLVVVVVAEQEDDGRARRGPGRQAAARRPRVPARLQGPPLAAGERHGLLF